MAWGKNSKPQVSCQDKSLKRIFEKALSDSKIVDLFDESHWVDTQDGAGVGAFVDR